MIRTMKIAALTLLLAACVPSPLYTGAQRHPKVRSEEVPRDARGEPVMSAIRPAPDLPPPAPATAAKRQRSRHWFGLF